MGLAAEVYDSPGTSVPGYSRRVPDGTQMWCRFVQHLQTKDVCSGERVAPYSYLPQADHEAGFSFHLCAKVHVAALLDVHQMEFDCSAVLDY